jgi:pimeloyl-ACP methyl ester carboxylesterase
VTSITERRTDYLYRKIAAYSESDYVLYGHAQMVATASKEGDPGWAATLAISCPKAIHRAATSLVQGELLPWRQLLFGLHMARSVIFGEHSLPHPGAVSLPRSGIAVRIVHNAGHFMMRDNPAGLASAINAAVSGEYSRESTSDA